MSLLQNIIDINGKPILSGGAMDLTSDQDILGSKTFDYGFRLPQFGKPIVSVRPLIFQTVYIFTEFTQTIPSGRLYSTPRTMV